MRNETTHKTIRYLCLYWESIHNYILFLWYKIFFNILFAKKPFNNSFDFSLVIHLSDERNSPSHSIYSFNKKKKKILNFINWDNSFHYQWGRTWLNLFFNVGLGDSHMSEWNMFTSSPNQWQVERQCLTKG